MKKIWTITCQDQRFRWTCVHEENGRKYASISNQHFGTFAATLKDASLNGFKQEPHQVMNFSLPAVWDVEPTGNRARNGDNVDVQ